MKQTSTAHRVNARAPQPPAAAGDTAALELLASWRLQDATTGKKRIVAAEKELAQFKRRMSGNRAQSGERKLFS